MDSTPTRLCEEQSDEAIHSRAGYSGLLRFARNDEEINSHAGQAVGLLEVYGLVTAFAAADAACKAAKVTIDAFDTNKPANADSLEIPLLVLVKLRGNIADIEAAMHAGEQAAATLGGVLSKHIIARPIADTEKLLKINALNRR